MLRNNQIQNKLNFLNNSINKKRNLNKNNNKIKQLVNGKLVEQQFFKIHP